MKRIGFVVDTEGSTNALNDSEDEAEHELVAELFGSREEEEEEEEEEQQQQQNKAPKEKKRDVQAAWVDEDDAQIDISLQPKKLRKLRTAEEITRETDETNPTTTTTSAAAAVKVSGEEYQTRLREQLAKLNSKQPSNWANLEAAQKSKENKLQSEAESTLLRTTHSKLSSSIIFEEFETETGELKTTARREFHQGHIKVSKLNDINDDFQAKAAITSVCFCPKRPTLAAVSSFDQSLSLFNVDGKLNSNVLTVNLSDLPIASASWNTNGTEIIAVGNRPFFYSLDATSGKVTKIDRVTGREDSIFPKISISPDGKLFALFGGGRSSEALLMSTLTKQLIGTVRNSGIIETASFSNDGLTLLTCGVGGEVFEWDVSSTRCMKRWKDEGSMKSTSISISSNSNFIAIGSDSGTVNVYNNNNNDSENTKPFKTIMNVTTSIDHVGFNPDSQLLAISSKVKKDCFKLVHIPSCTIFGNWPLTTTPLHHVTSFGFSPNGGLLAIGNKRGKALLFRMCYWKDI